MKKLIFILIAFAFCSCEVCEDCTTSYYDVNGTSVASTTTEVCGRKDIKEVEGETLVTSQGVTTKTTTRCVK